MKLLNLFFLLLSASAQAENLPCPPQPASEPYVYLSDFKWKQTLEDMRTKYRETYSSGKRLKGRAHWDAGLNSYVLTHPMKNEKVRISATFIRNITRHIEISLERRYADFIFFPDMGHSHLFVPLADFGDIDAIPTDQPHLAYERMFALPGLKVLYHTAEQLTVRPGDRNEGPFPQDKELLWRYFSRNPIGDNITGENVAPHFAFNQENYNTVNELKGHRLWSAGFTLSASKHGCFRFQDPEGQEQRFDISLEDLPYSAGNGGDLGLSVRGTWNH